MTPNSRSYLNRWAQPDSIVPLESQGVHAWDRYAYVNNNPVKYNDPSGHDVGCKSRECKQSSYDIPKLATPPAQNDKLASQLSAAAFVLDTAAVVVSGMNLGALYTEGGAVVAAGCAAGPEGCAAGAVYFFALDISLSQIAPTGIAENFLSGTSLVLHPSRIIGLEIQLSQIKES